jgi:hypothetical protein
MNVLDSKQRCLVQVKKQNTNLWQMPQVKSYGLELFSRDLELKPMKYHAYGAITWELHMFFLLTVFMPEQKI